MPTHRKDASKRPAERRASYIPGVTCHATTPDISVV